MPRASPPPEPAGVAKTGGSSIWTTCCHSALPALICGSMTQDNHEVAVVGGGLAGLVTALRLAERGVRVVVLEKGPEESYPCNARISGGGFHICFLHVE